MSDREQNKSVNMWVIKVVMALLTVLWVLGQYWLQGVDKAVKDHNVRIAQMETKIDTLETGIVWRLQNIESKVDRIIETGILNKDIKPRAR